MADTGTRTPSAGRPIVVKCGGADGNGWHDVVRDIAAVGPPIVIVHGGSAATDALARRLGCPPRRLVAGDRASRYTDAAALDALTMAVAGALNTRLTADLRGLGVNAIGLSGVDGGLVTAARKGPLRARLDGRPVLIRDDLGGRLEHVNADLLRLLLGRGYLPVVSPPAVSADGTVLNVDADRIAAAVAVALGARELVLLSNTPGLLRDPTDPGSLVPRVDVARAEEYLPLATGRMRVKLCAAIEAVEGGVGRAVLGDGRSARPLADVRAGAGTVITAGGAAPPSDVTAAEQSRPADVSGGPAWT